MNNEKKNYVSPNADFLLLEKEDIVTESNFLFSSNKEKENETDENEGKWYTPFVKW